MVSGVKVPVYVVAVSGGVDSAVLLDLLVKQDGQLKDKEILYNITSPFGLIVAHFDHGIRAASGRDRQFVEALAKHYKLPFAYEEGSLGPNTSEAAARIARYEFLRRVQKQHQAEAIITAHHQDDVIETAIVNLLRGTNRRGLSSLGSHPELIRPLLDVPKTSIISYAQNQGLHWREDPTNRDTKFLRNYVRQNLLPAMDRADPGWRQRLLELIQTNRSLNKQIKPLIGQLVTDNVAFSVGGARFKRGWLAGLMGPVAREAMRVILAGSAPGTPLSDKLIRSSLLFAKTARSSRHMHLGKGASLHIQDGYVLVKT